MTSRPFAIALLWVVAGLAGCPRSRPPGYLVRAPTEMSVHAAAILEGVIQAEEEPTPAVTVRLLLVPPECRVTVESAEPTNRPRVRIEAETAVPCTIALEFDDGTFTQRIDHTVRFLDVPTLLPIEGPHWLDACPGATSADRFGEVVACEIGDEVVVTKGSTVERVPGRLRATDRNGGWVVCTTTGCRFRDLDGVWVNVEDGALAEARWSPLDVPANTFVAILPAQGLPSGGAQRSTLFSRDGTAPVAVGLPFPDEPTPYWVADGVLISMGVLSTDGGASIESSWRAWLGAWTDITRPGDDVLPTGADWEPQSLAVSRLASSVYALRIDREARRVVSVAVGIPAARFSSPPPALGLPGTALGVLEPDNWLDPRIALVRLGPGGFERLALAPWPEALTNDPLAARLLTEDAVIITPTDGTPPVRLRVGP